MNFVSDITFDYVAGAGLRSGRLVAAATGGRV